MKRTLSIILILALTFSILPAAVHAGGDVRTLWEEDFNGPNAMRDWNVVDGNADGYSFTKYWPNQDGAYAASPLPSLGGGANGENSDEYLISPPIALPDVTMEYELNFECQMVRAQGAKAYTLCRVLVIDAEAALTAENLSALEARAFETDAFFAAEDWKQVRCDLTAYRGRTVRLVFHHFDDGGNELRLDNFRILECESDSHIVRVTVTGVPEPAVGKHVTEMHESDIRIFDTTNLALVPGSLQYLKLVDEQMVPVTDAFEEGGEYEVRLLLRVKEDAFYHPGPAGSVNGRRAICALREKDAPGDEDIIQVDYYFGYLHAPEACTVTFLNAHGDHPEPQTVPYGGCAVAPKGLLWTDAGTIASYIDLNRDGEENAFADIPQVKAALEAAKIGGPVEFIGARGSERVFFRGGDSVIVLYDDATRVENGLYAAHARFLGEKGIPVPGVLADLPEIKTLVMENAGVERKVALADAVRVVEALADFNAVDASGLELTAPFDAATWKWERDLFAKHCLGSRFRREMAKDVERELERVAEALEKEPKALVHRDFQSTNILWKNGKPRFIDFQGMRFGPAVYDLASYIYDPYVKPLTERERLALVKAYENRSGRTGLAAVVRLAAVERLVQCLGAYGRLASVGQPQFGKWVLPALQNLLAAADEAGLDAVGALAEDLIAEETRRSHAHKGCSCGHGHEGE